MPLSLFNDIQPCYVTMDYEKWYTSLLLTQCEEIRKFEIQNHINYMYISCFRCGVDHVYFILACKKSFLGETLLFQINLPLLNISLIRISNQRH